MKRLFATLLVAAPLAVASQEAPPAPAAAPTEEVPRDARAEDTPAPRVYLGLGLGTSTIAGTGTALQAFRIRLGVARSPRLMLGFEGGVLVDPETTLSTYDVGATFFPWGKYLYLRGAFGIAVLTQTAIATGMPFTEQGWNVLLGLGVALGRPRGFTITLNADAHAYVTSGSGRYEDGSSASAWLGVDWY